MGLYQAHTVYFPCLFSERELFDQGIQAPLDLLINLVLRFDVFLLFFQSRHEAEVGDDQTATSSGEIAEKLGIASIILGYISIGIAVFVSTP